MQHGNIFPRRFPNRKKRVSFLANPTDFSVLFVEPSREGFLHPMMDGLRILLVDDDDEIREPLADLLSDEGYNVYEAANGREALNLLDNIPRPDLILLDIFMPEMDGFEFRRHQLASEKFREIPVIVMSADPDINEARDATQARDFFRKPFNVTSLLGSLSTSLVI
jgi:CheY-like chemotaxis protein